MFPCGLSTDYNLWVMQLWKALIIFGSSRGPASNLILKPSLIKSHANKSVYSSQVTACRRAPWPTYINFHVPQNICVNHNKIQAFEKKKKSDSRKFQMLQRQIFLGVETAEHVLCNWYKATCKKSIYSKRSSGRNTAQKRCYTCIKITETCSYSVNLNTDSLYKDPHDFEANFCDHL